MPYYAMATFGLQRLNMSPEGSPKSWSVAVMLTEHTTSDKGEILLTPKCVTSEEIDYWVDKLINELKELRHTAHRNFSG